MNDPSSSPSGPGSQTEASASSASGTSSPVAAPARGAPSRRLWTVPNVLCGIRLIGSPGLVALAAVGRDREFLALFLFLSLTDWLDGKLAILLNQRSVFGARLDSAADATFYATTLIGLLWLRWPVIQAEIVWIALAAASYAVTSAAGLWKFGRWPSYHTRGAKTSWLLVLIATVSLLLDWSIWPLRIAAWGVTLTNIEATLITVVLPEWQADVPSLYHALRRRRQLQEADRGGRPRGAS